MAHVIVAFHCFVVLDALVQKWRMITFTFTFTHMMTRALLGVTAIVQFSAKYLQCNVFCFVGVFFIFLLFICIIVIIL